MSYSPLDTNPLFNSMTTTQSERTFGIDLDIVLQCLNDGIYFDEDGRIAFGKEPYIYYDKTFKDYRFKVVGDQGGVHYFPIKSYREQYALTKEELLGDLDNE